MPLGTSMFAHSSQLPFSSIRCLNLLTHQYIPLLPQFLGLRLLRQDLERPGFLNRRAFNLVFVLDVFVDELDQESIVI